MLLNPFPELLNYSILAPTLLRWVLAFVLISIGIDMIRQTKRALFVAYFSSKEFPLAAFLPWKFGIAQIILGTFFLIGAFTQISVLISVYILVALYYIENRVERILPHDSTFYLVMIVVSLSLLLTGAGAFAVDLPL